MFLFKYHNKVYYIVLAFIILISCSFQEPNNKHGIVFLKNRSDKIQINKSNKNDVIQALGNPHTKSVNNDNEWLYFERILSKGDYHKLGQNILKTNNILVLKFDKFGVVENKLFYDKEAINKMSFSDNKTVNELSKRSFVEGFLQSIKTKMYGNRK